MLLTHLCPPLTWVWLDKGLNLGEDLLCGHLDILQLQREALKLGVKLGHRVCFPQLLNCILCVVGIGGSNRSSCILPYPPQALQQEATAYCHALFTQFNRRIYDVAHCKTT